MARSILTTTVQRIQGLADQVLGLPPEEYHYFLDLIDPQPEPEAPAKQKRKRTKRAEPLSEERRAAIHRKGLPPVASGMAAAIKNSLEQGQQAAAAAPTSEDDGPKCGICGNPEDYQDHFKPSPNYHEFVGPKSKKATK